MSELNVSIKEVIELLEKGKKISQIMRKHHEIYKKIQKNIDKFVKIKSKEIDFLQQKLSTLLESVAAVRDLKNVEMNSEEIVSNHYLKDENDEEKQIPTKISEIFFNSLD